MTNFDWQNAEIKLVTNDSDPYKAYVCKSKDIKQENDTFYFVVILEHKIGQMFFNDVPLVYFGVIPNKKFNSFEDAKEFIVTNFADTSKIDDMIVTHDKEISDANYY